MSPASAAARRGHTDAATVLAIAGLLALLLVLHVPAAGAAPKPSGMSHRIVRRHAVVPVLAEAGGTTLGERQRGARVRIFAAPSGRRRHRRLVGFGRTGSAGVALVRLRVRRPPRQMLVVVGGGRLLGRRFAGHMTARLHYRGHRPVFVSPVSSLAAGVLAVHPRLAVAVAERRVRRALGLPAFFDFSGDLADAALFNGRSFVRRARRHGGFDRSVRRRVRNLNRGKAKSSSVEGEGCWAEASKTTAGFAELMGFGGVPSMPALSACAAPGASASSIAGVAHASSGSAPSILGAVTSVASLIYKVASGQSTAAQLAEIKAQLNEIQGELQQIQADLGELQVEVADVNANVLSGDETTLIGDAVPTINRVKSAGDETMVLLGAASQILCEGGGGCHVPAGSGNLSKALDTACNDETKACENFYTDLYFTSRDLDSYRPRAAVENLGGWADGSAFSGGAPDPGVVQYALAQGANGEQFFKTANAADARLQWAYYTVYSTYAQTTYATVLGMGLGQPLPNAHSAHPPKLTAAILREQVERMDKPIGLQIAEFPNMPDSAVIDTNLEATDGDPPYMYPQQIGGLASQAAFEPAGKEYELSAANVAKGALSSSTAAGQFLTTLQTSGEPPVVMTPAAPAGSETWELLPKAGARRSFPPSVATATFADWRVAAVTSGSSLPEWNATTQKVEVGVDTPAGPLPDLYTAAKPSSNQTAGEWMTSKSGIDAGLLTPADDYQSKSGIFGWYRPSGDDGKEPGLGIGVCSPAGDEECLLPTWQSHSINPFEAITPGNTYNAGSTQVNTGLFDLNNGLVIANQQGHKEAHGVVGTYASNPSAFVNQYQNWTNATEIRGVNYAGFLSTLNGQEQGIEKSAWSEKGRPVLFDREQSASDCFYWTPSGSGAAYGSGCLKQRPHSGEILP